MHDCHSKAHLSVGKVLSTNTVKDKTDRVSLNCTKRGSGRVSQPFKPQVGAVFSADIAVPEHDREVRFYSRVLGTGETPLWQESLLNNLGLPIIGLGALTEEYARLPLQWMPHIQVANVAESVKRALALGGTELMHSKSETGESSWAVLSDPNGAAFGLIPVVPEDHFPPASNETSEKEEKVGRIAWIDLTVANAKETCDFYRQVVGWSVENVAMQDDEGDYVDFTMLNEDGSASAGICHARGANADLPPVWMLYLPVGDLAESLRRVEEEGGKVLKSVRDDDGKSVYAAIQDPVGVYLALIQA